MCAQIYAVGAIQAALILGHFGVTGSICSVGDIALLEGRQVSGAVASCLVGHAGGIVAVAVTPITNSGDGVTAACCSTAVPAVDRAVLLLGKVKVADNTSGISGSLMSECYVSAGVAGCSVIIV